MDALEQIRDSRAKTAAELVRAIPSHDWASDRVNGVQQLTDGCDCETCLFTTKRKICEDDGIEKERIVLDPGIGFGKTIEHNLELLKSIKNLLSLERPILIGASRKSFISKILERDDLEAREWPTVALTSYCRELGATIFRVHSSLDNLQALRMTEAIINSD